ncbi:MAG TPA: dihydrolipoamide acetyltransferase family protein [Phycisphaerales bacterium]|nr:dihydrolipoamide acetyltransferase family protein [Phycisphaerales bacterium]
MAHAKSTGNPNDFILPDLGEGVHEAELIKWRVRVGDQVKEHDILAEMETDKALVEVPSPRSGVISALHGEEGQILRVGNPLVSYEAAGGAATPGPHAAPQALVRGNANGSAPRPQGRTEPETPADRPDDGTVVGALSELASVQAAPGKALATPAVRRLARDLGVDINTVTGTGIAGRVTEKDVRAAGGSGAAPGHGGRTMPRAGTVGLSDVAPMDSTEPHSSVVDAPRSVPTMHRPAAHAPAQAAEPARSAGAATRVPFRGVRRTIANRLRESVDRAVHFNVMDEADVSALDQVRARLGAASGEKLSLLPFIAAAAARVLRDPRFASLNSTVEERGAGDEGDTFIVQHRSVHLGIATDTETGLMVPVIRDADSLGVLELGRAITRLAASARDRSIPRESLVGSTFTISNVGSHAGRFATPVINYPEVAILAAGRARPGPVVRQTSAGPALAIGVLLPLSLACDHRVVDGATAALALARIIALLQDQPDTLMGPPR